MLPIFFGGQSPFGRTPSGKPYNEPLVARSYNDFYSQPVYEYENQVVRRVLEPLLESAAVLDLGAGTGLVLQLTNPAFYYAADSSAEMLQAILDNHLDSMSRTQRENIFTIKADLQDPFDLRYLQEQCQYLGDIDVITALWAAHHFHEQETYDAMFQIVARSGTVFFHGNMPRRKYRRCPPWLKHDYDKTFNPRTMKAQMKAAGFTDITVVGFNAVPDWLIRFIPSKWAAEIIWLTRLIPARYHYNAAVIGRKP